jgi:hypothetical protein
MNSFYIHCAKHKNVNYFKICYQNTERIWFLDLFKNVFSTALICSVRHLEGYGMKLPWLHV